MRAIRKGWIKLDKPKEKPKYYLMWGDDLKTAEKTANGLAYIPAPKPKLPGWQKIKLMIACVSVCSFTGKSYHF